MPRNQFEERQHEQSRLDIMTVIGHDLLEEIQQSVADVTGIAFVTVDYKGDVLTKTTHFCKYCKKVRNNPTSLLLCKLSDASGAIIAATNKEVSIYICPCGLLEIAIPIIVDGQYLGGFIGGQILCDDAPDTIVRLSKNMVPGGQDLIEHDVLKSTSEELDDIKRYSYSEVLSIAKLVEFIINQLTNHEIVSNRNKQKNLKRIDTLELKLQETEDKLYSLQTELMQCKRYIDIVRNCKLLDIIDSLSILENAPTTEAAILDYIHTLALQNDSWTEATIKEECSRIETMINLLNYREECHVSWKINVDESMWHCMVPAYSIWQYVQHIIEEVQQDGQSEISIMLHTMVQENRASIILDDDKIELESSDLNLLQDLIQEKNSVSYEAMVEQNISSAVKSIIELQRMFITQYGTSVSIDCHYKSCGGMQVILSYPLE